MESINKLSGEYGPLVHLFQELGHLTSQWPESGKTPSQIRASFGMLRIAQPLLFTASMAIQDAHGLTQTLAISGCMMLYQLTSQACTHDLRGKDEEYSSLIEDMQEEDSEFLRQESAISKRSPIPLLASPFAYNLDKCLVYLDEAYTRADARGALTLGLDQTKDHTVQGLGVGTVTVDWNSPHKCSY
jgi:hypothetical protein